MDLNSDKKINKEKVIEEIISHSKKITGALYKITELFPDKEPLKWTLRSESVKIFKLFILLNSCSEIKKTDCLEKISAKLTEIEYLLEIASVNSYAVNVNFEIIKREYENINNLINSGGFRDFEIEEIACFDENSKNNLIGHKGQDSGDEGVKSLSLMSYKKDEENKDGKTNKMDIVEDIGADVQKDKEKDNTNSNERVLGNINEIYKKKEIVNKIQNSIKDFTEREIKILDIVKAKESEAVSINEIFTEFKGISKKTIQRELIRLVNCGVLMVYGTKRWRTYKIRD